MRRLEYVESRNSYRKIESVLNLSEDSSVIDGRDSKNRNRLGPNTITR
jgi:hypothetical protein